MHETHREQPICDLAEPAGDSALSLQPAQLTRELRAGELGARIVRMARLAAAQHRVKIAQEQPTARSSA